MNDAEISGAAQGLILGVDGGGSKTLVWLARLNRDATTHEPVVIGRGTSGSSNVRAVGVELATHHLNNAIEIAFSDARIPRVRAQSACLGLAGADRDSEQRVIRRWADEIGLATNLIVTNDAIPVLHAACGSGPGIALIAGTGSFCIGRGRDGQVIRCGGWGYLLGDEGSGYWIAMEGLRAVARSIDATGEPTELRETLFDAMNIAGADQLISTVYQEPHDRPTIAALAPLVFQVAGEGDPVAQAVVDRAIGALGDLVVTVANRLELTDPVSLGLTGGLLLNQSGLVEQVVRWLAESGVRVDAATRVDLPVAGALSMACDPR